MMVTDRLYFRKFTIEDAEILFHMHQDAEVTKYTGDPLPWDSIEQAEKVLLEAILPQYQLGIGRFAVHLKSTNEFIGWCGIKRVDDEYDIGYRYIKNYWGKGYATEAAKAILHFGISKNLHPIIGRVSVNNLASKKVLENIGLSYISKYNESDCGESLKYLYIPNHQ